MIAVSRPSVESGPMSHEPAWHGGRERQVGGDAAAARLKMRSDVLGFALLGARVRWAAARLPGQISIRETRVMLSIVRVPSRARKALAPLPFALSLSCGVPPSATIGTVAVDLRSTPDTPAGTSFDVGIRFDAAPNLVPLDDDHRVFLHVLDDAGEILWTDEHEPPVPTSAWRPGETLHYTRSVRVAAFPYFGPATVAVGLDLPHTDVRLLPARRNEGELPYATATLTLDPPADRSLITFDAGWYRMEFNRRNGRSGAGRPVGPTFRSRTRGVASGCTPTSRVDRRDSSLRNG